MNKRNVPAYFRLYEEIRQKITDGYYKTQNKLPSKRELAHLYGVSISTVSHAYALLEEEGYVEAKERSGYFVSTVLASPFETEVSSFMSETVHKIDTSIPFTVFARTARRVLSECGDDVLGETDGRGSIVLRRAIVAYLGRARGIRAEEDQILIGAGSEAMYSLIVSLLGRSRIYGIEDPSYHKIRQMYRSAGVRIDPLKLGKNGILETELERTPASVLHVTPYRSMPTGISADSAKRSMYLQWAKDNAAWIIEDDYSSEFVSSPESGRTLYAEDPDHVIYMNTFTKTISPSMRAGYMVLPRELLKKYEKTESFRSCTVSLYLQYILAELLNDGDFERHLNRLRKQGKNFNM